jgi:hypothetical protein
VPARSLIGLAAALCVAAAGGCGGAGSTQPAPTSASGPVRAAARGHRPIVPLNPAQAAHLRRGVVAGVRRDFAEAVRVPAGFPGCFIHRFRRDIEGPPIERLAAVYRDHGQPAAAQALNSRALPAASACGHEYEVPELVAASKGLRSVLPGPPPTFDRGCDSEVVGSLARNWRRAPTTIVAGPLAIPFIRTAANEPRRRFARRSGDRYPQHYRYPAQKALIVLKAGASATLSVGRGATLLYAPSELDEPRSSYELSAYPGTIRFVACAGHSTQFNGGFVVAGARCVPIRVWARDVKHPLRRWIPFGTHRMSCPPPRSG